MNTSSIKDNWDDSSESEQEEDIINVSNLDNRIKCNINVNQELIDDVENEDEGSNNDEAWDFYEGYTACINCGNSNEVRIIMIESKRIFCYDACLDNDEIYDDGDDDNDDYEELDKYDRKLGLSVSCR